MAKAALLMGYDDPFEIADIEVLDPGPRDVRVRLASSGVCGSDQTVIDSRWSPLPIILGHEAAGVVEAVGEEVDHVRVGDHVVLASASQCGHCFYCSKGQPHLCEETKISAIVAARRAGVPIDAVPADTLAPFASRYRLGGAPVYRYMWTGTFAEVVVCPRETVIPLDKAVPLEIASLLGCAVITGVGAVLNGADVAQGDTVAVVGAGGVGLNAIQGARIAGAERIVAVDVSPWKLELAEKFGATDVIDGREIDPVEAVLDMTRGYGADVALEAVHSHHGGQVATDHAFRMTRNGGQVLLIGGAGVQLPAGFNVQGKRVTGVIYGNADLRTEFDRLARLYLEGVLLLDELATKRLRLPEINDAFAAMKSGETARSLIVFD
jgi:S-(hydroxymethyl)glutathione dehydrogenase / alcohol dehydrogenase